MAFNPAQQATFDRQINRMKEDGFFLPAKRSLAGDTRYLIVSYGGTGADALFGVKKLFETVLPQNELDSRVRFLAIDTDIATQSQTKQVTNPDGTKQIVQLDALTNDQFFQLAGTPARLCLNDAQVQTWINPQLRNNIETNMTYLDGTGASGTRQVGRLTLYPAVNINGITGKVQKLVGELTNGNAYPLRVFILSGIAGGTGSGTVIDLSYLLRHILENMPGNLDSPNPHVPVRTKYSGFILLPPTGTSTNPAYIKRGNRNGYAALKEINYFMNLITRGGEYKLVYGNAETVRSEKNIFDTCYLTDGTTAAGVAYHDPRGESVRVLAESILDMVTASQVTAGGDKVQAVDSFMSDHAATRNGMIAGSSIDIAKRDADYVYCALGHNEFALPSHEIKAYVAKQMFDQIYALFLRCDNVEQEDVHEFLRNVIRENGSKNAIQKEINHWFTHLQGGKGGPYFVINLLKAVSEEISRQKDKLKLLRIGAASTEVLDYINSCVIRENQETFEIYTKVMDALKNLMEEQFGVVVKAGKNGNTYSFIPESLGQVEKVNNIIGYLKGLINKGNLMNLMNSLLEEMINNKEAWTSIISNENPTAASNAMRRFWYEKLDELVDSTIEDFLIKYYSGNPDAYYSVENHNQTYPYLQEAAKAIFQQMLGDGGNAQPMLQMTPNGMQADDFNPHTYLMVPEKAKNLLEELQSLAAAQPAGKQPDVCASYASDRISCYKQYTSIPAYKLQWVSVAEPDYEHEIVTIAGLGTHISETTGGNQWKNFPNLLPKSTWSVLPDSSYTNPREGALAQRAEELFDRVRELKMTSSMMHVGGVPNVVYTVQLLPEEYRPSDELYRDLDRCTAGSVQQRDKLRQIDADAEDRAKALFALVKDWADKLAEEDATVPRVLKEAGVAFGSKELVFGDSVLTVGPNDKKPEHWDEYMAKCMLRKLPDTMNQLYGTVMVMEKVMQKVEKSLKTKKLVTLFAQYLVCDMFFYDSAAQMWKYKDANGFDTALAFIQNDMQRLGEYYYMFDALRSNSDEIMEKMKASFTEKVPVEGCTGRVEKIQTFIKRAGELKAKVFEWNQKPPIDPYAAVMQSVGYNVKAIKNFYRALYAELNTMSLVGFIPVEGSVEVKKTMDDPFALPVQPVVDDDDFSF